MINPDHLHLDSAYTTRTYSGCYEGVPSVSVMIEKAKQQAKELWGDRKTLVIEPTIKNKMLPTWSHMVWVTGPALKNGDGSELVIIWWAEPEPDGDRTWKDVDWEKNARDWEF